MQFVRAIIDSNQLENIVDIPGEFRNQKVEVLILPLPETKKKKREFNPDDFEGILDIPAKDIEMEIKSAYPVL